MFGQGSCVDSLRHDLQVSGFALSGRSVGDGASVHYDPEYRSGFWEERGRQRVLWRKHIYNEACSMSHIEMRLVPPICYAFIAPETPSLV